MSHIATFKKRRAFVTLVEMLIVISILLIMSGVIGINVRRLIIEQRFDTEVSLVVDELRLAQDLLLILRQDNRVIFKKVPNEAGIQFSLLLDKLLPNNWNREIIRKRPPLTAIKKMTFQDNVVSDQSNGPIEIKFQSGGSVVSSGVLMISSSEQEHEEGAMVRYICFPGFPSPIHSVNNESDSKACDPKAEAEYNDKLTFIILREVGEREQKDQLNQTTNQPSNTQIQTNTQKQ